MSGRDTTRRVRGFMLGNAVRFVEETYPPAKRQTIESAYSPELRRLAGRIERNTWYPLEHLIEVFDGLALVHRDPKELGEAVERAGRFLAEEATNTFMRLLLKILTPRLFASKFNEFWKRYHEFGELRYDVSDIDRNVVRFEIEGYDYLHFLASGWIRHVFEALGKSGIRVETNVPLGERSVPLMKWEATWS